MVTSRRVHAERAIFYRVVKTDPPTARDFLSAKALGRPLRRDTPENRRIWDGLSVLATTDAARTRVAQFPQMGTFIAVMDIAEAVDGSIPYEQMLGKRVGPRLWLIP